ncbi:hypothetical protein TNIN_362801 [Trichonephila inaurata madagascariensis]|uniref:Uncharacterized protein n=1 Tax=Trichonephila inaurata madagascariensis TaxID=2747483 RepID=A0A8X6YQ32_9ARAC|nr:hypothetical protein TNIN_362801 [Trichonephila inaurata madagascariensis]
MEKVSTMFSNYAESNGKHKCESLSNTSKKMLLNENLDVCLLPCNAKKLTMNNPSKHMIHLGGLIFHFGEYFSQTNKSAYPTLCTRR